MAAYEFVTIWRVHAPIETVWEEIYYSERWSEWWPGVEEVEELKEGDDLGVGSIRRYTWKSKLPYKLTFDVETV
jgi:carbon monoxide dehydrogenase subunit G